MLSNLLLVAFAPIAHAAFNEPLVVAEPQRLAWTPIIDGKMESNEWDAFASQGQVRSYLQWEPGAFHAAAVLAEGQDLVLSIDLQNNGWLIGKDNVQVRVSIHEGKAVGEVAVIDASRKEGPVWVTDPSLSNAVRAAAQKTDQGWAIEMSLDGTYIERVPWSPGATIGARIDGFESGKTIEPYLPRVMSLTEVVYDRGSNVQGGLRWKPQIVSRTVSAGEVFAARLTFNGTNEMGLDRIEMETREQVGQPVALVKLPFPTFDKKGRAYVDFRAPIAVDAQPGFRVLSTVVTDKSGNSSFLRTSFRVAPVLEFNFVEPRGIRSKAIDQKVRIPYYIQSNRLGRLDGEVEVSTPGGWLIESGENKRFTIYNSRSSVRRVIDVIVPANAKGRFPIALTGTVGGKAFSHTGFVKVD